MGRTVTGGVSQVLRAAHQYLFYRYEEANAKRRKEQIYKAGKNTFLSDYVAENGEETPEGHQDWMFDKPLNIGGVVYTGLRNQRTNPQPLLDEDRAIELIDKLGLRDRVAEEVTITRWNWAELYVLQQQGLITEEQLDSLFDEPEPSWSLVVLKP